MFNFGTGAGTASTFTYTGGALVVYADYVHTASTGAAPAIPLRYATAAEGTPSPNGWTSNSTKYTNNSTTTPPTTIASSTANHPHMRFTFAGNPCTAPPTPGTATASPATAVCPATAVTLNISGNSVGAGQTYKWQSALALAGPYTDITTESVSPSTIVNPTVTTYYRAVVTCSGQPENTTPVLVSINGGLAGGNYTINSAVATGGSNYQTFADAIAAISCGILGPVVFNVDAASGPYNEQLIIPQITNSSSTNTVTFNGNGRTIQAVPVTANRSMIRFDGADYVIINNLNMVTQDATYGWGVHFTNLAENNQINNCNIDVSAVTSTTQSNSGGIIASASTTSVTSTGNVAHNNIINGNTITGGYQGIIMHGNTTDRSTGNSIINNTIIDFYANGIELTYHTGTNVANNDLSRPNRTSVTTFAGIEIGSSCNSVVVNANRIHNTHNPGATQSGTAYGIYVNASDAVAGTENVFTNNLIYDFNSGTGIQYGIYNSGSDNCKIYHNTIVLDNGSSTSGTTRGFYQTTTATGIDFKNNLITISRAGTGTKHAIYFGTVASTITSDNNNLHVSTAATHYTGYYNATNQLTLSDWQTASSGDASSLDLAPLFAAPGSGNYSPILASLNNMGTNVGVATDIVNNARSASTPDIGAYEFDVAGCIAPPTAGSINATPNGTLCSGTSVEFSLTGNSIGTGQTYTLQSSLTSGVGFADISAALDNPLFSYNVTETRYYRIAVTCSGNTQFSNEILITVPALFPAGTYTINSNVATGGSNFQTFADAIAAINCGIAGPIVFNVDAASGPYNEQVIIPDVPNTSAVNTLLFNGNGRTISFLSTNSNERAGIKLNGTDYTTISNFVIIATGTTTTEYGFGIQVLSNADNNQILNNTININTTSTSANYSGIAIGGTATGAATSGSNTDNTLVSGNTVTGGNYGISLYGATGAGNLINNNQIVNNIIRDQDEEGIYVAYTNNTLVENNDISRPTRTAPTDYTGIYFVNQSLNGRVSKNKMHDPYAGDLADVSAAYGIYFSSCDATPGNENIVSNNIIYNFNGGGAQYGIYNTGSDSVHFLHNSIALNDQGYAGTALTRGFHQSTTARGIEFRNNIISITRSGTGTKYALYFGATTTASTIVSNQNNLYVAPLTGNNYIGYLAVPTPATSYATIAEWNVATGQDQNSVVLNPLFTNEASGNLLPQPVELDNLGSPVGITSDILNVARSASTPDIGAYEFTGSIVLPIKIVNIYAGQLKNDVSVNWNTSVELNASHFEVERSVNGTSFVYAGTVQANNAANGSSYRFTDINAVFLTNAKTIYYRVKMVDMDGSFEYSPIAVAKIGKGVNFAVEANPNPFKDNVVLKISTTSAQQLKISLIDFSGKTVYSSSKTVQEGVSLTTLNNSNKLAPGIYLLHVQTKDQTYTVRLLKQ